VLTETFHNDDEFQRELVELFGQEAQEWLVQIDGALTELETHPAADRHLQLVEAIVRAITSLGGSAATINLPEVERATFALLPFIDTVRDPTTATKQDYSTVREQFTIVTGAVREATGSSFGLELPAGTTAHGTADIRLPALLDSLRALHEGSCRTDRWARHLLQNVIRGLEQQVAQGKEHIESAVFRRMVEELNGADGDFFLELQRSLPGVQRLVDGLKRGADGKPHAADDLLPSLTEVERLRGRAKQIHAIAIATFLTGLHGFITILAQGRLSISADKLEAVAARITAVLETTHQWVQSGQEEQEAILKLLPDGV
jgi:HPt (histidine-containing phosphotransfer) domain-containing protein